MFKRLLTIFILCLASLTLAGSTYAGPVSYFSDTETTSGNSFSATTLDFSLRDTADVALASPVFAVSGMLPGDSETKTVRIKKDGESDFKYQLSTFQTAGDAGLCTALQAEAKLDSVVQYSGSLLGLTLTSIPTISGSLDDWDIKISLSDTSSALQNKSCSFNLKVSGWQTDSDGTWGLTDQEEIGNSIATGSWVPASETVTVRLFPVADSYMSSKGSENNDNYGVVSEMKVKSKTGELRRSLLRFDLGTLPPGSTINSCNLKLYMNNAPGISRTYGVHRLSGFEDAWTETGVSWNNYKAGSVWGTAGGDFNAVATATVTTGTDSNATLAWNVTGDCGLGNRSWVVKDEAEGSGDYEGKFRTKEEGGTAKDPYLEINYTIAPVSTSHVVINEVYYDVASGKGSDPANEWVELYNPTSSPIDISGWKICDAGACDTIPLSTPVPAYGFAVITPNASTWPFWSVPAEAIKIVLGSNIGGGLNDDGDQIILKNEGDAEQDKMSYGSETSPFILPDVDKGWSLARLIKGYDTDSASDFWANPAPNPGTNPEKLPEFAASSRASEIPVESAVISIVVAATQESTPAGTTEAEPIPTITEPPPAITEPVNESTPTATPAPETPDPTPAPEPATIEATPTPTPESSPAPEPASTPAAETTPTPTPESSPEPASTPAAEATPTPASEIQPPVNQEVAQ